MRVTNTSQGPRGLNTKTGTVILDPGQSMDVELEDAEKKVADSTGWFAFGAKAGIVKTAEEEAANLAAEEAQKEAARVQADADARRKAEEEAQKAAKK